MKLDSRVYNLNKEGEIIYEKTVDNVKGIIVSLGTHPCCYVQFPGIDNLSSCDDVRDISVHGGFTFLGELNILNTKGTYLGWDYAHYSDYLHIPWQTILLPPPPLGKAWTLDELKKELHVALLKFSESNYIKA